MMSLFKTTTTLLTGILLLLWQLPSFAQAPATISGTVRDENAAPVIAATVLVQGTTKAVLTDTLGHFSIDAPADAMLVISSIGFQTQSVKAQRNLAITLKTSSTSLNDVVVIGYGTSRRKEVTGAIAVVDSRDFQKGSITTPEQLIAGKVAGVSITANSGSPGAGSTIRIRGSVSLNASNDPLFVVDGVPLNGNNIYGASNPLSTINPNDIESMTVLKDAASTAIYGSRASNGVIIITTKKGSAGKPVFNFNSQVSVGKVTKELPVLSAQQFRNYVTSLDTMGHSFSDLLGNANTNWQQEIYHGAVSTDNNLSVSGALKHMPYRLSVGYLEQEGIVKTDRLARQSAGISLSPRFFDDHLKIDVNLKGALSQARFANGGAVSAAAYFDPTQPVHAPSPFGNYFEWATIEPNGDINLNKLAPRNPLALLDLYRNTSNVSRSYGNIQFDYKFHFLPELHANLNLGYDVAKGSGHELVPAYAAQNWLDTGRNNQYANKISNQVVEFYLNYNKDLKAIKSNLNVTAGYGYYNNLETQYSFPILRANGDTVPNSQPKYPYDKPQTRLLSYYGRLIYTFNQKYILAASVRTDGSSRFGPDDRWGLFPSVALTWRVNQENFLKDSRTLSDLKLRLSYGVTGNQDGISPYAYQANYSLGGNTSKVQFGSNWYNMASPAAYDA
ncbi:MAG TPA: SusC/RagA family TonB-linked outer membrane protein, partial [Chitinophaga sp.]